MFSLGGIDFFLVKLELGLSVVDSTRNLNDLGGTVVTSVDTLLKGLIKEVLGEETTNEGVTSTVRVDNEVRVDLVDGVLSHLKGWIRFFKKKIKNKIKNKKNKIKKKKIKKNKTSPSLQTRVHLDPWVKMTIRGLLSLTLGKAQVFLATSFKSSPHPFFFPKAAASISLPKRMSA